MARNERTEQCTPTNVDQLKDCLYDYTPFGCPFKEACAEKHKGWLDGLKAPRVETMGDMGKINKGGSPSKRNTRGGISRSTHGNARE